MPADIEALLRNADPTPGRPTTLMPAADVRRRADRRRTASRGATVGVVVVILAVVVLNLGTMTVTNPPSTGPTSTVLPQPVSTVGRAIARWTLTEGQTLTPETTTFKVDVRWQACADGAVVTDPQPVIAYAATEVSVTIWGVPPTGKLWSCQMTPTTTVDVTLAEPLGDRTIVPGADPTTGFSPS